MEPLIETYAQLWPFLTSRLVKTHSQKFEDKVGLAQVRDFMTSLGNPQDKIPTIHIAGTAGKGSTAASDFLPLTTPVA